LGRRGGVVFIVVFSIDSVANVFALIVVMSNHTNVVFCEDKDLAG
jgi:hypothetical protein